MYEQVFNFNARPFNSTPYVKHYFPTTAMAQAVGQATICIQRESGPVVAIGDVGTGKSLLLAKLSVECQSAFQVVNVDCSQIRSGKELFQNILFQLGKPINLDSETELRFAVTESVNPTDESSKCTLLLADDADKLTVDVLEAMRTLTNIVVDGSPRVQLVLAGRQTLEEQLADPTLVSFSQRIACRVFLSNLSREDTFAYVVEHINRVGGDGQAMFSRETVAKLHDLTDGCPRLINQVGDFVLILAATRGEVNVSASLIEEAWNDVQSLPMGSVSAAPAAVSSTTNTNEASDWTVIEFGQLDDDSPDPAGASVYDFENAAATPEANSNDLDASHAADGEQATSQEIVAEESEDSSDSGIDSDLGVDFSKLQAMQDAVVAEIAPEEPTSEPAENSAQLTMEQELNAIFGTSVQPTDSGGIASGEASEVLEISQAAVEPEAVEPEAVEPEAEAADSDDSNGIVGLASAAAVAAGTFAGVSDPAQEDLSADSGFQPATSALSHLVGGVEDQPQDASVDDSLTPVSQSIQFVSESKMSDQAALAIADSDSFTPATEPLQTSVEFPSVGLPSAGQANQTSNDESSVQFTVLPATKPESQTGDGETIEFGIGNAIQATEAPIEDPFAETFATEKNITDQIVEDSGIHNRNALKLSSADLSQLTPLHNPTADQLPQVVQETPSEPVDVAVDAIETADEIVASESEISDLVSDTLATEMEPRSEGSNDETTVDSDVSNQSLDGAADRGFSILSEVAISDDSAESIDLESEVETEIQVEAATSTDTTESTQASPPRSNEGVSDEISRQADEILARLQANSSEINQEKQILEDIREQQQIFSETQASEGQSLLSVTIPDEPKTRDDSEILIVTPSTPVVESKDEPEVFPLTDSPISSGRATRIDYEELFDRLRDQQDESKQ